MTKGPVLPWFISDLFNIRKLISEKLYNNGETEVGRPENRIL